MPLQFLKSLHLLKIKIFSNVSIFISLIISLALFNLLFFYLINVLFFKNSVLFVCIFINLNILFIVIINKYELYIDRVIFSFL